MHPPFMKNIESQSESMQKKQDLFEEDMVEQYRQVNKKLDDIFFRLNHRKNKIK